MRTAPKIACTVPPVDYFGGRDFKGAQVIMDVLSRMGLQVLQVETKPFMENDVIRSRQVIAELKSFAPDFAISLPNAGYALSCVVTEEGIRKNIFTEILEIPLAIIWDDPLGQFAHNLPMPYPETPQASSLGALSIIRSAIDHPLMTHFAWDSGHISALDELGILPRERVHHNPLCTTDPYLAHGIANSQATTWHQPLSFVGNVYTAATYQHGLYQVDSVRDAFLAMASWRSNDIATPAWRLLERYIGGLSTSELQLGGLTPDNSFFWRVYEYLVWVAMNTHSRMNVLESLEHPVAFFGGFADPAGVASLRISRNIDYRGVVDYVNELPEVFRSTRITIDITNQLAQKSSPCKLYECFAAGGFMLIDRKPDIIEAFGDIAEKISYQTIEELNEKIEYYLAHDTERADISAFMKNKIATCYTTEKWLEKIVGGMGFGVMKNKTSTADDSSGLVLTDELYEGKAMFLHREKLAAERPIARLIHDTLRRCMKVGHPGDLPFNEWGQLMAFAYAFKPDLILEIGRGYGNSTCVFAHVANMLAPIPCRVASICLGDWNTIQGELAKVAPPGWFDVVDVHTANILTFDYEALLNNSNRVLVFWDAHGYAIAECVLSRILPILQHKEHVVAMHDIGDARYQHQSSLYGTFPPWPYGAGDGICASHIRLGNLYSAVEQSIAIYDFSSRNDIALFTAAHSLHAFFDNEREKYQEVRALLHDDMFSLDAGWIWFSLDKNKQYTFPLAVMADDIDMPQLIENNSINEQIGCFLGLGGPVSDDELNEAAAYIASALSSGNINEYLQNMTSIPRSTKPLLNHLMTCFYNKKDKVQFELLMSLYNLM